MPRLNELQREFAAALLDSGSGLPDGLTGPAARRPVRRFAVYRNNVHASLIGVLKGRFPVVARLVGDEFFRAMAREFVAAYPPSSPLLMTYGAGFPGLLEGYGPVQDLPYLPDVARLEWAWNEAYHAADAEPIRAEALAGVEAGEAEGLTFTMHPSLRLVRSPFPALSIWEANQAEGEVPQVDPGQGAEDALVVRPGLRVEIRRLPPGGAAFVAALARGETLGAAAAAAGEAEQTFNFEVNFAGLLRCGALAAIHMMRS